MTATICESNGAASQPICRRPCPVCGADNRTEEILTSSKDHWELKNCKRCGMVYLENPPPVGTLVDHYNWTSTFKEEAIRRRVARPMLSRISGSWKRWRGRWLPRRKLDRLIRRYVRPGKLLDIGCGTAAHFDRMPNCITPFGIEIDSQTVDVARQRAQRKGGDIIHADALSGIKHFKAASLNGIVMHSFLEHEVAPLELLLAARRSLKERGVLIIKVPNFTCWNRRYFRTKDWPGFRFPDHVNYFTPQSLKAMIERSELRVLQFSSWDRLPCSDNMWLVATR